MCGIIARDKYTYKDVKKEFKHYGDAIRWISKYAVQGDRYGLKRIYPRKSKSFWNNKARMLR